MASHLAENTRLMFSVLDALVLAVCLSSSCNNFLSRRMSGMLILVLAVRMDTLSSQLQQLNKEVTELGTKIKKLCDQHKQMQGQIS